jgi:hypothetical protein
MKVIFLDFDGVLNTQADWDARPRNGLIEDESSAHVPPINPRLVATLNRIIEATGAVCVLSTSWRKWLSGRDAQALLWVHGFKGEIIGSTPTAIGGGVEWGKRRGWQIREWLRTAKDVDSYVVLDDHDYADTDDGKFVQTPYQRGLTEENADRAIELLGRRS